MNQEYIGKIIKKIRQENNLTQKEFADKYNVSFQAVSKWENGKNIPDIVILKQICNDYNISIDEVLGNNFTIKHNRSNFIILFVSIFILLVIISLLIINSYRNSNFEFKKITTSCSTFKITGSAAYNSDKSSIYISNIEFCGDTNNKKYKKIEYILFENHDNTNIIISSGDIKENITLIEYLENLKINVNDYSQTCKYFSHSKLYIEINASDYDDIVTTYKIPIAFEDNCE